MKSRSMIELTRTECRALRRALVSFEDDFASERAGRKTLSKLVALGLMEQGPESIYGSTYRATDAGKKAYYWNCERHGSIER